MSKALATLATRVPILPRPITPKVAPARSRPTVDCHGPESRIAADSWCTPRSSPSTSAQVSSAAGAEREAVPQTVMPRPRQAARSMEALREPLVTISRSSGSRARIDSVSGVRSRITTTICASLRVRTTSSGSARWRRTGTTSTPCSTDQSAYWSATSW